MGWAQVPWYWINVSDWIGLGDYPGARSELVDASPWDSQTGAGNPRLMHDQPNYMDSDT